MNAQQHSPAPWEYRAFPTEQGVVFDISITEPGGVDVAYTYSHEANARLIAAAPDLLLLLTEIVDAVDFERGAGKENKQEAIRLLIAARAAIAKAVGSAT